MRVVSIWVGVVVVVGFEAVVGFGAVRTTRLVAVLVVLVVLTVFAVFAVVRWTGFLVVFAVVRRTDFWAGFGVDFRVVAEEAGFLDRRVLSPSIDLFEVIVYNYNMKAMKITKKQQAVLNFLEDFTEEKGYSPSYREIQAGLGLSSVSAVAEHIDNMVEKGILKKVPGAARSLEVLDFRHTETVELFRARLLDCTDEERATLLAAAEVLGLDLGEE